MSFSFYTASRHYNERTASRVLRISDAVICSLTASRKHFLKDFSRKFWRHVFWVYFRRNTILCHTIQNPIPVWRPSKLLAVEIYKRFKREYLEILKHCSGSEPATVFRKWTCDCVQEVNLRLCSGSDIQAWD